jgi:hypothetical protein
VRSCAVRAAVGLAEQDCGCADHIIPVIDGSPAGPLRVLCRSCNSGRDSSLS